ncbi:MAG TPA: 3-phosphoserine/phosphohydroxythreonine transaminase [Steroidobacteraceae bacterium]|nr:3-phosphoserine/phosphohydroxythreonine transaminase [Steroidobacteraceae bacterium]
MRVFNFAPGPATLPLPVLEQAQAELTDWRGSGMSVMEISHRSKAFLAVAAEAEADLRELMAIPSNYKVLFLQGGAAGQFAAVPMNLTASDSVVDYVNTGSWSKKALGEAHHYCRVNVAADAAESRYNTVPPQSEWRVSSGAAYLHYTPNETIGGVEYSFIPKSDVPLVADMSSTILSRPLDVSRFGLIYAGAQKNIGPSGLVIVIVREDLLGHPRADTPLVWNYTGMAADGSMSNTPPTFAWYIAGLTFKWLKREGGLAAMAERNRAKAQLLYRVIDESGFYRNPVEKSSRSWMNVPFILPNDQLDKVFLSESAAAGLTNLAGHRSVGGMRASLYNAMPLEGVQALTEFMRDFARRHG